MSDFLTNLITIMGSVMTLLITLLKSELGQMVLKNVKSAAAQKALTTLNEQAFGIVSKYQQTLVAGLREAAKDGKLTREELKTELMKVKIQAQGEFAVLAKGGFAHLLDLLVDDKTQIAPFLDTLLESAIYKLKTGNSGVSLPAKDAPSSTWASIDQTLPPIEPKLPELAPKP